MSLYCKNGVKDEKISEDLNRIYKKKYRMVKKLVKRYVYENAALCDQVFRLQEKMIGLKEERIYLLKKVYQFESSAGKSDSHESSQNYLKLQMSQSLPKSSWGKKKTDPPVDSIKMKSKKGVNTAIKRKTLVPVPVDSSGLPVFPVNLGSLSVHSLGEIITDRLTFHDEDLIYPVGFCSTRVYGSLSDPTLPCIYTCMILDGGTIPIFEVASDTDLETSISGDDINVVHSELLKRINQVVGVEVVNTRGRGADFFGISHPTVMNLLQSSPGIKKCIKYKMTKFEINRSGEPYIEENDASLRFESLQRSLAFARSHLEDMDRQETLDSTTTLRADFIKRAGNYNLGMALENDARTLFIGNLHRSVTEEILYELFFQAGPVERVNITRRNNSPNFGFVTYKHESSIDYALELFKGTSLFQKELIIKKRVPKQSNDRIVGSFDDQLHNLQLLAQKLNQNPQIVHFSQNQQWIDRSYRNNPYNMDQRNHSRPREKIQEKNRNHGNKKYHGRKGRHRD